MNTAIRSLFLATLLGGCASARMKLPEGFEGNAMEVDGRSAFFRKKNPLTFGPFEAAEIDRSWTRGRSLEVGPVETSQARQTYRFELRQGRELAYEVSCGAERADADLTLRETETSSASLVLGETDALTCTFDAARGFGQDWTLQVLGASHLGDVTAANLMRGTLSSGERTLAIEGVNGMAGTRLGSVDATGYLVREGQEILVAVDVLNQGTVWVAPAAAQEPAPLAAAAAALLLFPDLEG